MPCQMRVLPNRGGGRRISGAFHGDARTTGRAQVAADGCSAGPAGAKSWGGDQQYAMAAAVAVTYCSPRSAVGDRSDQHIAVVVTAMVCCSPWPSPSVTTGSCRDGGYAPLLRRGTLSTVAHPVERLR